MNTYTFHVSGTHCPSCKIFIEDTLNERAGITRARVDLKQKTVTVSTTLTQSPEELAPLLTHHIQHNGYSLSVTKNAHETGAPIFWHALPIGLGLLAVFFFLQASGILNFGIGGMVTPTTSLVLGLIASVSSCLAVVGGLVLSLSATVSQDSVPDTLPMILFHVGRLLGFAVLGGVLGTVGSALSISFTASAILGLVASVVMILLGLHLVGIFQTRALTLPAGVFRFFRTIEHKTLAPLVLGVGTFFLPCGFTQAMQFAALSSGSFLSGFFIMGAFAIGTFPMLALLSFGSASIAHSRYGRLFFASAGVVVIGLGVFALLAGLAGLGIIPPLFIL